MKHNATYDRFGEQWRRRPEPKWWLERLMAWHGVTWYGVPVARVESEQRMNEWNQKNGRTEEIGRSGRPKRKCSPE